MNLEQLQGIIFNAETIQHKNAWDKNEMIIMLKEKDFNKFFKKYILEEIELLYELPVKSMCKFYGFEFRPHNIENQDVLICLKHNVK